MLTDLVISIGDTALAEFLRRSTIAYPLVSSLHIYSLGLLAGSVTLLDLRIIGLLRRPALTDLVPLLQRSVALGAIFAIISGLLLFSVQPADYLGNQAFLLKMGVIGVALVNVAVVHWLPDWRQLRHEGLLSGRMRVTAGVSLLCWLTAILLGRWIAFV